MLKIATKLQHDPRLRFRLLRLHKDLDFDLENGRELLSNVWRRKGQLQAQHHNSVATRSAAVTQSWSDAVGGIETRVAKVLINFSQAKTGLARTDSTARQGRARDGRG